MPKPLLIKLPDHLWAKLQTLRAQGFTASGYIRALLERELAAVPPTSPGQHPVTQPAHLKANPYSTNKRRESPRVQKERTLGNVMAKGDSSVNPHTYHLKGRSVESP